MTPREVDALPLGKCQEWTKYRNDKGYGVGNRKVNGKWVHVLAHRVAWEAVNGPVPTGLCVCHKCDNPPCIRIEHLFLGTHSDNMQDAANKGRNGMVRHPEKNPLRRGNVVDRPKGSRHGMAVLVETDIPFIRALLREGLRKTAIADRYGVSRSTISLIANGRGWLHVA